MTTENTYNHYESLIVKYLSNECSPIESEELLAWVKASEDNKKLFVQLQQTSELFQEIDTRVLYNTPKAIKHFELHINQSNSNSSRTKQIIYRATAIAASIIVLLGLYFVLNQSNYSVLAYSNNTVKEITLPDQSIITLNKNSEISIAKNFTKERNVKLKGEAFFNVTPDINKPFTIITNDAQIKVLGTSFNVFNDTINGITIVTVKQGKVQVTCGNVTQLVTDNESAIINNQAKDIVKHKNNDTNYDAWKTKIISFNDTPLPLILKTINKLYNSNIKIADTEVKSYRLNAKFDLESIDKVKELLAISLNIEFKDKGHTTYIYKKKQ